MEFGSDFDDDLFFITKSRTGRTVDICYNVKEHSPKWFKEVVEEDDCTSLKFCGDWAYKELDYEAALTKYHHSLDLCQTSCLAPGPLKRELWDSITRCYCHLRDKEKAISACNEAIQVSNACTIDQKTQILQLQCFMYEKFSMLTESVFFCQQLCILHPADPSLWLQLCNLYGDIIIRTDIKFSCMSVCKQLGCKEIVINDRDLQHCEMCLSLIQLTCAYKTLVNLKSQYKMLNSFAKERNISLQEKIENILSENLTIVPEYLKTKCHKFVNEETLHHEEDVTTVSEQHLLSMLENSQQVFESKWFSWMTT